MPDGDVTVLAVVSAIVFDCQRCATQNLRGLGHIQTAGLNGYGTLRFVELDAHKSCYYNKSVRLGPPSTAMVSR